MKLLVTGGLGFIGSNFILKLLKESSNFEIINVDAELHGADKNNLSEIQNNEKYEFVKGNITNRRLMEELISKCDAVVNFAAESFVDRSIDNADPFLVSNIRGSFTILDIITKQKKRMIQISTDEVFGSLSTGTATEKSQFNPSNPYAATKAAAELLIKSYVSTHNSDVIITRCTNNYGPRQFPEKLIPLFINNIVHNKPLPVYGKGENVRDWLFVKDHAVAIDVIFHKGKLNETYNIGGFNEWKNIDLIKVIIKTVDKILGRDEGTSDKLITYVTDRAGHDLRYAIDSTKLKNELGWEPSLQFEEGIEKTVKWYLDNKEWMDNVSSGDYQEYYKKMYN